MLVFLLFLTLLSLMLLLNLMMVWFTMSDFPLRSLFLLVVIMLFVMFVRLFFVVLFLLMLMMMKRSKLNPYVGCTVTFPEPWVAIRRPGVRLCFGDPVEILTSTSHYCVPVYTLSDDDELTKKVKEYAHYFHVIKGHCSPDVTVSYLTIPRLMLALRVDVVFRDLVLSSPLCIVEG